MEKFRLYGKKPYNTVLVHGGPGAPGSMRSLAVLLSPDFGIIEPLQSANSIEGQLNELKNVLDETAELPAILVGHSWGAWLSFIFASKYSEYVKKLIIIGSGPFLSEYIPEINKTRNERFSEDQRKRIQEIQPLLMNKNCENRDKILSEFGQIMNEADSFHPLPYENEVLEFQPDIFAKIMGDVSKLRESKKLLNYGKDIKCPVIGFHGDYDPHPFKGVEDPLASVVKDFKFILLKNCGHTPWREEYVKDRFLHMLYNEIVNKF